MMLILAATNLNFSHYCYAQPLNLSLDSAEAYFNKLYYRKAQLFAEKALKELGDPLVADYEEASRTLTVLLDVHVWLENWKTSEQYGRLLVEVTKKKYGKQSNTYNDLLLELSSIYAFDENVLKLDSIYDLAFRTAKNKRTRNGVRVHQITTYLEAGNEEKAFQLDDQWDNKFEYWIFEYEESDSFWPDDSLTPKEWVDELALKRTDKVRNQSGYYSEDYAYILYELASKYDSIGSFNDADSLYKASYSVSNQVFGKYNQYSIEALKAISLMHYSRGEHFLTQKLFNEIEKLAEETYGENSVLYAQVLTNYLSPLGALGQYEKASELANTAMKIYEREVSKVNIWYASFLLSIDDYSISEEDYNKTIPLVEEVIDETRRIGIYCNSCYTRLLLMQADFYEQAEEYRKSEEMYFMVMELEGSGDMYDDTEVSLAQFYIRCKALGVTDQLDHYGELERVEKDGIVVWQVKDKGDDAYYDGKLERIFDEDIERIRSKYGNNHPYIADLQFSKGMLYWDYRAHFETIAQMNKALNGYLFQINNLFPHMTEDEKTSFYSTSKDAFETLLSFIVKLSGKHELLTSGFMKI